MIKLKDDERLLRRALITEARGPLSITLAIKVGVIAHGADYWVDTYANGDRERFTVMLYHVNTYEMEHGRPQLGVFVTPDAEGGRQDAAHFWTGDIVALVDSLDAQTDAVMAELSALKQLLRKMAHGGDPNERG